MLAGQIPDIDLTIRNGLASTTVRQPFVAGDGKFVFILNTTGKLEDLDKYPAGILILEDRIVAKKDTADVRIYPLKDFPDGTFTKPVILDWLKRNQLSVFGVGFAAILLAAVFITSFTWIWKIGGIAPILISAVSVLSPAAKVSSIIQLGLLLLYSLGWLWYLPKKKL
ncbi:MAG: hypothetical protein UY06_C0005G0007 [Candidatus Amesbacteria bacterium GW2011_GWA2_47_70]|nr:MAG: hypothetical protein UY06_C0005G0007 [Candidatus Amesbacteria bacterium GW2011_GWA2_47_70]